MKKLENTPSKNEIIEVLNNIKTKFSNDKFEIKNFEEIQKHIENTEDLNIVRNHNVGIKMQKRIKRYINKYISKSSKVAANNVLWLISKHVLELEKNASISEPKHDLIQKKRKAWKTLERQANIALREYKEEKGNYYKKS